MKMITKDTLKIHLGVFETLIGIQPGHLNAQDLIFAENDYIKKCKIESPFYNEALQGISKLNTWKYIPDIDREHLYYNPVFTTTVGDEIHDKTITPFFGNTVLSAIRTYGDLLKAEIETTQSRHLAAIRRKKASIHNIRQNVQDHQIVGLNDGKEHYFKTITQKIIYSELLHAQSRDHPYQSKWLIEKTELGSIDWDKIWASIHNSFLLEKNKKYYLGSGTP